MTQYEKYISEMKRLNATPPYMTEQQLNEFLGIREEVVPPLVIAPKADRRKASASLESFIKVATTSKRKKQKNVSEAEPKKTNALTDEQRKLNRTKSTREKREAYKAQGVTVRGTPFKVKGDKPEPTTEETRKKRAEYAKTYRTNNRDKHLQYRRDYRKRVKNE